MQGTQAAQLAHMVNAYNALSMFNVVASGIPATHAGFNKVTFCTCASWRSAGR